MRSDLVQPFCCWRTRVDQIYDYRAGYGQGLDYQLPCDRSRVSASAERQSTQRAIDRNQAIKKLENDTQDTLITMDITVSQC